MTQDEANEIGGKLVFACQGKAPGTVNAVNVQDKEGNQAWLFGVTPSDDAQFYPLCLLLNAPEALDKYEPVPPDIVIEGGPAKPVLMLPGHLVGNRPKLILPGIMQ